MKAGSFYRLRASSWCQSVAWQLHCSGQDITGAAFPLLFTPPRLSGGPTAPLRSKHTHSTTCSHFCPQVDPAGVWNQGLNTTYGTTFTLNTSLSPAPLPPHHHHWLLLYYDHHHQPLHSFVQICLQTHNGTTQVLSIRPSFHYLYFLLHLYFYFIRIVVIAFVKGECQYDSLLNY